MTEQKIQGLGVFPVIDDLPQNGADIDSIFQSPEVKRVICFCLGPEGTNIVQAARQWIGRLDIVEKSNIVFGDTPEDCLTVARQIQEDGTIAVFWTCAVYSQESQFFFGNPDTIPFFIQETMPLDEMQLAIRPNSVFSIVNGKVPNGWRIASHPSPQHLLKQLDVKIILVNSNSAAAKHCVDGLSDACITTESAREIYGLKKLHSFGSPTMIFFGGITQHGAKVIKDARKACLSSSVAIS